MQGQASYQDMKDWDYKKPCRLTISLHSRKELSGLHISHLAGQQPPAKCLTHIYRKSRRQRPTKGRHFCALQHHLANMMFPFQQICFEKDPFKNPALFPWRENSNRVIIHQIYDRSNFLSFKLFILHCLMLSTIPPCIIYYTIYVY